MDEDQRKEVRISKQFDSDIISVYTFGEEVFGAIAAKVLLPISTVPNSRESLDSMYMLHAECRHLPTKDKRYRNIILGSYLIIYRITPERVEVLRILHSHLSIGKIRASRQLKL